MNRKEKYADLEKYRETARKQKRRYYGKTAVYEPHAWTKQEEQAVLDHKITDCELSALIGHSVSAIQKKRHYLKKESASGI